MKKKKFDSLDELQRLYEALMPETVYLMKNPEKYDEIVGAIHEISGYIKIIEDSATFKVYPDELTGTSLALEVTCTLLSLSEVDEFCSEIKRADTIDIIPLTNGDLSVTFGFKNAYIAASPLS